MRRTTAAIPWALPRSPRPSRSLTAIASLSPPSAPVPQFPTIAIVPQPSNSITFTFSAHAPLPTSPRRSPDRRTLALGKTISTLRTHLPTVLTTPLPSSILSPQISLHLFPRTHPHLPAVSGRVAYKAALWTAPVAWGRVPLLGDVRLQILSERVEGRGAEKERMVVRWRTMGKRSDGGEPFEGLFVFEFDGEGRVGKHTIECVDEGGHRDVGRVVGVVEWLLGRLKRGGAEGELALGCVSDKRD